MKKSLSLLLLSTILALPVFADKVSKSEAQRIAEEFLAKKHHKGMKARLKQMPAAMTLSTSATADYAPFYVYNAENNNGFVIVSGESKIGQIIGYSDTGAFDFEGAPSNVVTMMKMFSTLVKNIQRTGSSNYAEEDPRIGPKGTVKAGPLLDKIQWGQGKPFNLKMPKKEASQNNPNTNYYVGCVATAMSQIMRYHKYPAQAKGAVNYTDNLGNKHQINYSNVSFDWTKMPQRLEEDNNIEAENNQVSTLSSMAAYSVYMSFMPSGEAGAFSQAVTGALVHNFGYDNGISYKKREYYSTKAWMKMITDELDAGRPVYYSASNEDGKGGHAFVCDGYDSEGYVHINWGWYGRSNGYFKINALNPYELGIGANGGGYNLQQEIIIGIQKPTTPEGKKHWSVFGETRLNVQILKGQILGVQGVVSHDCDKFTGKLALVLINKEGKVVSVLTEKDKTFKATEFGDKLNTDGTIETIWANTYLNDEVKNGSDYRILFAVKANGEEDWTLVPSQNNLPNYAQATVENRQIVKIDINEPKPNVSLLEPITTSTPLYAKGGGKFKLVLKNNSDDFIINHIWLKFTDINDNSKAYYVHEDDTKTFHQIYDQDTKTIYLVCPLDEKMPAGKYKVMAFEKLQQRPLSPDATPEQKKHYEEKSKLWEGDYFKPVFSEPNILEVKSDINRPLFGQEGDYTWLVKSNAQLNSKVKQGESIALQQDARNYGAEGKATLVIKARSVEDPSIIAELAKISEASYEKLGILKSFYGGTVNLNPGKYILSTHYIVNGKEYEMDGAVKETILEVVPDETLALSCNKLELVTNEFEYGKSYKGNTLSLSAKEDIEGARIYIWVKSVKGSNLRLVGLFPGKNLKAGETYEIPFDIKSYVLKEDKLPKGAYNMYVDYVSKKTGSKRLAIGGNSSRIVYIGITAGIDKVANQNETKVTVNGKTLCIENANNVRRVEVYTLTGTKVFATANVTNSIQLPLQNGMYVIRIVTAQGIITKKVVLQ